MPDDGVPLTRLAAARAPCPHPAALGRSYRTDPSLYERASSSGALLTTYTLGRAFQVPVFTDWRTRIETLNAITRRVASTFDAVIVDFYDHPVNDRPELVSADGIHFSAVGQAVMAAEYIRHLGARR